MNLIINRFYRTPNSTIGSVYVDNVFIGFSLELGWKDNQRRISCIPSGEYELLNSLHTKFGRIFRVKDVPNRSGILIHPANRSSELLGCISIGSQTNLNSNLEPVVLNTKATINELVTKYQITKLIINELSKV